MRRRKSFSARPNPSLTAFWRELMTSDDKNTLVDRWTRSMKNQPILASLILLGVVLGAIASFTDSISKIAKFWRERQEIGSIAGAPQLKPDYSKHTRLWYPSLLHPELRPKVEALRKFAAESNIYLQYFETYRPPEEGKKTAADAARLFGVDGVPNPRHSGGASKVGIHYADADVSLFFLADAFLFYQHHSAR